LPSNTNLTSSAFTRSHRIGTKFIKLTPILIN
jgi:hypothetical protein